MSVRNILMAAASGAAGAPPGQVLLRTGTTSWTVPAGVTSICVVAVQGGGAPYGASSPVTVTVAGSVVCRAQNVNRLGDGGGDGGTGGQVYYYGGKYWPGSGGGAGGYSGNGGQGGGGMNAAANGNGGGGGGGATATWYANSGFDGGGVGLLGQGSAGTVTSTHGNPGSNGTGITYGGGLRSTTSDASVSGGQGGALAYKNNISVTPGQTITLSIPETLSTPAGPAGPAAVRIIWGAGRSFPSTNTGDI